MDISIQHLEDPRAVLDLAGSFLHSRPVEHNLILTLLQQRAESPQPGNYWVVLDSSDAVGVVFSSPATFPATTTRLPIGAIPALTSAIASTQADLPGISGDVATAAAFSGCWTESVKGSSAVPARGERIYELRGLSIPSARGSLRAANESDRELLATWYCEFGEEVGDPPLDTDALLDSRLSETYLWIDAEPVSFAALSNATAGTQRIGPVYTPPHLRRRGYAAACVAGLSARAVANNTKCVLYTDLGNATSNSIYKKIGYEPVAELLQYRFHTEAVPH